MCYEIPAEVRTDYPCLTDYTLKDEAAASIKRNLILLDLLGAET